MSRFLSAYFSRLGWTGTPDVSLNTLRELHIHHNGAIPFENLDVLLPREIHLDDRTLEEKLINGRRGGYCFAQNGLLERVLRELGFNVRSLLGRVVLANPSQMPPRTHRLLLVEVDGERWIADVGFGGQTLTAFDVTMDIVARTVTRQGKAVELTPREFDLLEQLMRNRGAALYRDVLYGRVWGGDLLDSRTLDLHIQRLRKKLGWADKIETVYRVGYRLKSDQK